MKQIEKMARNFALLHHGGQRYGEKPYIKHLEHVHQVLERFDYGRREELVCGAYLHDVVEDTPASVDDVNHFFGERIAKLVEAVTDIPGKDKRFLFERKTKKDGASCILKAADRIANMEACLAEGKDKLLSKYLAEMPLFFDILKIDFFNPAMGRCLRELELLAKNRLESE